jgi:hypothetical protein
MFAVSQSGEHRAFCQASQGEVPMKISRAILFVMIPLAGNISAAAQNRAEIFAHPFTMAAGGGVDLTVSHRLALRLGEFDYVLTRYTNPLTSTNNQNNFRYCGGVILRF